MGRENVDLDKRMYSSSSISDVMGCPRLFYFNWVRNLEEKETSPPLVCESHLECWMVSP